MSSKLQSIVDELTMLTGIVTDDVDYMLYLLLKKGSYFQKEEVKPTNEVIQSATIVSNTPEKFEEWFNSLEEFE